MNSTFASNDFTGHRRRFFSLFLVQIGASVYIWKRDGDGDGDGYGEGYDL